jgi:catechol 2,3-dioxygenase-like lactoylglutathione lyase family enzyme
MRFSIGEINVICTDADRSLRFYRDILGFEPVEQEGPAWRLKCGSTYVLLLPVAGAPRSPEPYCSAPTFSFDLLVDDIEAAYEYLQEKGVDFETPLEPGSKRFFLRDPDGLVLEVIEESL